MKNQKLVILQRIKSYTSDRVYAEKYDRVFFEKYHDESFVFVTVLRTREKLVVRKELIGLVDKYVINNYVPVKEKAKETYSRAQGTTFEKTNQLNLFQ